MPIRLAPLAFGTLTTWLLAGSFSRLLSESLPAHQIAAHSTGEILLEVLTAPVTLIAVLVIGLGLAAWWQRDRLTGLSQALAGIGKAAANSFGFEAVNRAVVVVTQDSAEKLRSTQTGMLSWNVASLLV